MTWLSNSTSTSLQTCPSWSGAVLVNKWCPWSRCCPDIWCKFRLIGALTAIVWSVNRSRVGPACGGWPRPSQADSRSVDRGRSAVVETHAETRPMCWSSPGESPVHAGTTASLEFSSLVHPVLQGSAVGGEQPVRFQASVSASAHLSVPAAWSITSLSAHQLITWWLSECSCFMLKRQIRQTDYLYDLMCCSCVTWPDH